MTVVGVVMMAMMWVMGGSTIPVRAHPKCGGGGCRVFQRPPSLLLQGLQDKGTGAIEFLAKFTGLAHVGYLTLSFAPATEVTGSLPLRAVLAGLLQAIG